MISFGQFGKPLFIPSEVLAVPMFAPGIISLAFYKRKPSLVQVILGLVATIVLSALLGYISPGGPLGQIGSVIVAGRRRASLFLAGFVGRPLCVHRRRAD